MRGKTATRRRLSSTAGCTLLSPRLEREDRILLRRDGSAIAGGGTEMPILECCKAFVVDVGSQALKYRFLCDLPALVDRDLNDLISRRGR